MVLTLASDGRAADVWRELALTSLFVQWVALSSLAVLCLSRPLLLKLGNVRAALLSWLTILAVTALVTEVAWRVFVPGINASAQAHWQFTMTQPGVSSLRPLQAVTHSHDEFMLSSLAIAAIVSAVVLRYFYVQFQWKARVESENQARLQALQSRIRPHFLFNSMNTIASLARSDPALAEQVTEDLAALFRVSLADAQVSGTVGQEMELCRQYLRIEGVRLGERLKVTLDVDALPDNASLPTLTLQPLVENAVYHGVEPSPDGGDIVISAKAVARPTQNSHRQFLPGQRRNECPPGQSNGAGQRASTTGRVL